MAPEEPGNLAVIDLRFEDGELIGQGERIDPENSFLTVSWYSGGNPQGHLPVGRGVAYVYETQEIKEKREDVWKEIINPRPTEVGSRYKWKHVARGDGLMFILILPSGYTITDPEPSPEEAKNFENRLALYWMLEGIPSKRVEVVWGLKKIEGDLGDEVKRINEVFHSSKQAPMHGAVGLRYDVALSFAGENRDYVDQVATILREKDVRVFYDKFEEAKLWGKDLYEYLSEVYQKEARYTVIFISEHYAKKLWTSHERKSAQARAFKENCEYILPARFDDTEVPGLLPTIAYVSLREKTPEELAELIVQKLQSQ
jgi:hypothetical protein